MNSGVQTPIPDFPPVITLQPVGNDQLYEGDFYTLTVEASGSYPRSYQWRKDDVEIPGATSPSLTLSDLQTGAGGDGGVYTVVVSVEDDDGGVGEDMLKVTVVEDVKFNSLFPVIMRP
jgi:hypothetical protein